MPSSTKGSREHGRPPAPGAPGRPMRSSQFGTATERGQTRQPDRRSRSSSIACGVADARRRTSFTMCASSWYPNSAAVRAQLSPRPGGQQRSASARSARAASDCDRSRPGCGGGDGARCTRTPSPASRTSGACSATAASGSGGARHPRDLPEWARIDDVLERHPEVRELTRGHAEERGERARAQTDPEGVLTGLEVGDDRSAERADHIVVDDVHAPVGDDAERAIARSLRRRQNVATHGASSRGGASST